MTKYDITEWIKSSELKELYERQGFCVTKVLNFSVIMSRNFCSDCVSKSVDYRIEIPNGAIDNAYDIKNGLFALSRITKIDVVDLFLSHKNVIKRIISHSEINKSCDNSVIKSTALAIKNII